MRRANALASAATLAIVYSSLISTAPARCAAPDPGTVITAAEVSKVMGGKFKARSPEPGALFYEEDGGEYRTVNIFLASTEGKSLESLKQTLLSQGEPVEDVAGIPDRAIYRPQGNEAQVEKKAKSGEQLWLSVAVHNAASANAKRFAIELAKLGAAKL